MDFTYPPEIRDFQQEVRDFIQRHWDDEVMDSDARGWRSSSTPRSVARS